MADAHELLDVAIAREERAVAAMEKIADALTDLATMSQRRLEYEYPTKPAPRDATVTHRKTEQEILEERSHASPEEIESYIGPREQSVLDKQSAESSKRTGTAAKVGSSFKTGSE